jgi:hypothetical protein
VLSFSNLLVFVVARFRSFSLKNKKTKKKKKKKTFEKELNEKESFRERKSQQSFSAEDVPGVYPTVGSLRRRVVEVRRVEKGESENPPFAVVSSRPIFSRLF